MDTSSANQPALIGSGRPRALDVGLALRFLACAALALALAGYSMLKWYEATSGAERFLSVCAAALCELLLVLTLPALADARAKGQHVRAALTPFAIVVFAALSWLFLRGPLADVADARAPRPRVDPSALLIAGDAHVAAARARLAERVAGVEDESARFRLVIAGLGAAIADHDRRRAAIEDAGTPEALQRALAFAGGADLGRRGLDGVVGPDTASALADAGRRLDGDRLALAQDLALARDGYAALGRWNLFVDLGVAGLVIVVWLSPYIFLGAHFRERRSDPGARRGASAPGSASKRAASVDEDRVLLRHQWAALLAEPDALIAQQRVLSANEGARSRASRRSSSLASPLDGDQGLIALRLDEAACKRLRAKRLLSFAYERFQAMKEAGVVPLLPPGWDWREEPPNGSCPHGRCYAYPTKRANSARRAHALSGISATR